MKAYPKMLQPHQTLDKSKRIVKDAIEEEKFTGVKMNEDGTPFEAYDPNGPQKPPTLQQLLRQGYTPGDADKILTREKMREKLGFKPYGNRENPVVGGWAKIPGGELKKISSISDDGKRIYLEGVKGSAAIEELIFVPASDVNQDDELDLTAPAPFTGVLKEEGEE